jgi:cytochrome c peroxidase
MKTIKIILCLLAATVLLVTACNQEKQPGEMGLTKLEPVLPVQAYEYANDPKPAHIPADFNVTTIENNAATLGRVLFYDKMLSINNSVACASCHIQQLAFSDGKSLSGGITENKTSRNSMAIMNAGRENSYFWDMREQSLKSMVLKPIQNHVEMGFDNMAKVVANVQQTPYYKELFEKAFGTSEVTEENLASALSQFIASMKSHNSKYDIGKQIQFANFNSMELIGMDLFTQKLHCKSCHEDPDFTVGWGGPRNIGLDMVYADNGLFHMLH